jgi:hypothetical protein
MIIYKQIYRRVQLMKRKLITAAVAAALILTVVLLLLFKSCRTAQILKRPASDIYTAKNAGGHPALADGAVRGRKMKLLKLFSRRITKGILVMKTDMDGNSIWAKVFDAGSIAWGDTVYETSDRNFTATVTKYDAKSGAVDSYIYAIDPEGVLIGMQPIGTEGYESKLSGGGSVSIGCADRQGNTDGQIFINERYPNGAGKIRIM